MLWDAVTLDVTADIPSHVSCTHGRMVMLFLDFNTVFCVYTCRASRGTQTHTHIVFAVKTHTHILGDGLWRSLVVPIPAGVSLATNTG